MDSQRRVAGTLTTKMDIVRAAEVLPLLQERLALMPGGRDRRGGLLLLFPTTPRRERAKPEEYRRLLQYLTAIPNDEDRAQRFTVVVDMRASTWDSVKPILKVCFVIETLTPARIETNANKNLFFRCCTTTFTTRCTWPSSSSRRTFGRSRGPRWPNRRSTTLR